MAGSVEEVCLRVLQPALYDIGLQWTEGEISVTSEHFGCNLIRSHVAQLIRLAPAPLREETVLVGCAPGELHDVGALMLTLFLRRRGFDVIFAGANVEAESFIVDACKLEAAAVCLSASSLGSAKSLGSVYERMNGSYQGVLAFGGRVFQEEGELIEHICGMYLGPEAETATKRLETALSR
jgi:methanogenic corrinoid protein MtbC1